MKLENIGLFEVETRDGFLDVIDLDQVRSVNMICDFGAIKLSNGLIKCVRTSDAFKIKALIENDKKEVII